MSSADDSRPVFALDQNFPEPILGAFDRWLPDVRLVPIKALDHRFPDYDDRPLLLALEALPGVEGLVTNNYKMLRSPSEAAAICATHLTVIAVEGHGDDAARASGAILLDLPGIMHRRTPGKAEVF